MKPLSKILSIGLLLLFSLRSSSLDLDQLRTPDYPSDSQWTIVGAGPAGIIIIGLLLDLGTDPQNITWIDPEFNIGRLGKYYANVPGNSKTKAWVAFLNTFKCFQECTAPSLQKLQELDQEKEYELKVIIDPLIDICKFLCTKVKCKKGMLTSLDFENNLWQIGLNSQEKFSTAHVVLATGSHPKQLNYDCKNEIPLDLALDKPTLAQQVTSNDTVAVVGSAQSAILLLKHLTELEAGRMINFYRHSVNLANPEEDLFGSTAEFAKNVLAKNPPVNLLRLYNTPQALKAWLPICTKIIYAIGYERNELPQINGTTALNFDDKNGIIGPRLFGIGIAFPEQTVTATGGAVYSIGLMSFLKYAQRILPEWIAVKTPVTRFANYEDLFTIELL